MARSSKLRISRSCEAGVRYLWINGESRAVNFHEQCTGWEDRRVGRNFRCQCACHKAKPRT